MENYGEAYKRELERIKEGARDAKRAPKATFDVHKTMEKFQQIIEHPSRHLRRLGRIDRVEVALKDCTHIRLRPR